MCGHQSPGRLPAQRWCLHPRLRRPGGDHVQVSRVLTPQHRCLSPPPGRGAFILGPVRRAGRLFRCVASAGLFSGASDAFSCSGGPGPQWQVGQGELPLPPYSPPASAGTCLDSVQEKRRSFAQSCIARRPPPRTPVRRVSGDGALSGPPVGRDLGRQLGRRCPCPSWAFGSPLAGWLWGAWS